MKLGIDFNIVESMNELNSYTIIYCKELNLYKRWRSCRYGLARRDNDLKKLILNELVD